MSSKSDLIGVVKVLKDLSVFEFSCLRDLTAVDYRGVDEGLGRFKVVYNLLSLSLGVRVRLKIRVQEEDLIVQSVTELHPRAG